MSWRGWTLGAMLLCGCVPAAAGVVLGARGGGGGGSGSSGAVTSPVGSAAIYSVSPGTAPRSGGTTMHLLVNPGYIMPRGYEFAGTLQFGGQSVDWLRNEGGLQFADRGTVLPSAPGQTSPGVLTPLQSGDLDGDGRRDLMCGANAWLAEPAPGTYRFAGDHSVLVAPSGARSTASSTSSSALGDVDGDGDLDFVSADFDGVIRTFENR